MYMKKNSIPVILKSFMVAKLFVVLFLASSCSEEEHILNNDGHQYITFTVSTPYSSTPTYAMTEDSENAVKTVDVLAFRVEGGDERFTYRSSGTEIQNDGQNEKKTFKVSLRKDEDMNYRFVVIANAADELDELSTTQNATKSQLLARLISRNSDRWNANSEQDFKAIPMWGETMTTMKITDAVKKITGITLLRSLVSIDVAISGTSVQNVFKLNEVYLYNRKTRGRIVPIASHFNSSDIKVTEASMPADNSSDPLTIWDKLKYTTSDPTGLRKTIYTYEAPGVANGDDFNATCIVIGGLYNSTQTYYRLDFIDKETDGSFKGYRDLLRNHRYTLNITNVTDDGYDSPDEAFFGKKIGITVDIEAWSMSDMAEIMVDEEYYLQVSKGTFNIVSTSNYQGRVTVQTDHPDGWNVSVASADNWITITHKNTSYFNFTLAPLATGERTGTITIKVGNLTKTIKVRQSAS